jgi:hypothetical protein
MRTSSSSVRLAASRIYQPWQVDLRLSEMVERVAVITDVHANLPALEAAVARIDTLGVEAIYCGGDLVGYGPHPNEVCALIENPGIPTIYGNYDYAIARGLEDCGCAYRDPHERENEAPGTATCNLIAWMTKSNPISAAWRSLRARPRTGDMGLLLADSQNLNADIWVELGLAGAATLRLRLGPDVDLPSSAASPRWPPSPKLPSVSTSTVTDMQCARSQPERALCSLARLSRRPARSRLVRHAL